MKLYVASSWRNVTQPDVVEVLRRFGHEVYDFRNPAPGNTGFSWSEIDPDWKQWTPEEFRRALEHPVAVGGFDLDFGAMQWADAGVLALPCGRSAHLEAGYFVGAGKPLFILQFAAIEPELMYRMATKVCVSLIELVEALQEHDAAALPC